MLSPMARTAVITGASSGLGAEFARQLAASGMDLVLIARDRSTLEVVATEIRGRAGVKVEVLPADLVDPGQRDAVLSRLADPDRPVDVLVNNAGFGLPLAFEANGVDDEARHLALHVEVPMRLTHAVLPGMLARRSGTIVNVASVAAFLPRGTYGAAKAWLVSFSRWANAHYRGRGVTVTAVAAGFVHTDFHARLGLAPGDEGVADWMWLDTEALVREALCDASRGRSVSIPSRRYKLVVRVARFLPDAVMIRAAGRGR
jgi:short-subunit dehydrogenase